MRRLSVAGAVLALVPCLAAGDAAAPEHGEIAVVGVAHAPEQFISPAMSPAYVRVCLEALRPRVIGVETDPEWIARDRFDRRTYEAETVAVPWALARGVAVYGVGSTADLSASADERERIRAVRAERDALEAEPREPSSHDLGPARADEIRDGPDRNDLDFLVLNGPEHGRRRLAWIDSGRDREGSSQAAMAARDSRMAGHVADAAARHPGERMVVIVGAERKADLERLLGARGFVILGLDEVGKAFPIHHPRSMDSLLTAMDAAAILLTALDTGDWRLSDDRTRLLLGKLSDVPVAKARTWYRYAVARRAMLAGRDDAARGGFERVLEHEADTPFPYRGTAWRLHLRVRQAARLELGRLADLAGDRETAVGHYRALLDSLEVPEYSEDYPSDFLYVARAVNAVRALIREPWRAAPAADPAPKSPEIN